MDLGLRNRVYVVTGGTRGLGLATARRLIAEEACVVISGRDGCHAVKVAAELGDAALGVGLDIADRHAADQLVAAAIGRFGSVDGALVAMDGDDDGAPAGDTGRHVFGSVFLAAVRVARAVGGAARPGGAIAFVLECAAQAPFPGGAGDQAFGRLRPGLALAARTLADELGPRGIRVNGLMPGRIAAAEDPVRRLRTEAPAVGGRHPNDAVIPLRRTGSPDEFAAVAAFVLSPVASYLTGAMIPVDGGAPSLT